MSQAMVIDELAPGVYRVLCPFGGDRAVACHLLIGKDRSLLIDTGMIETPEAYLFPFMDQIGFRIETLDYVLITHSDIDHQAGNDIVKAAAPNARFLAHNLDIPWIESPEALTDGRYLQWKTDHKIGPDEAERAETIATCGSHVQMDFGFEGGEWLRLGPDWAVEIVHTSGHTWGHSGVFDHKNGVFIAGESALWNAILGAGWEPKLPPTYCYVDTYLATLERLRGMPIQVFSPAHWPVTRGNDIQAFLDVSKSYCLHVEAKLRDAIRAATTPITLRSLIERLKPEIGTWPSAGDELLAFPFNGNLQRLEDRRVIERVRTAEGLTAWVGRA